MGQYSWDALYIVLHAHALLPGEVVGMVLEWMVKQQFNFFAQLECEMSSPFLVTLSNCLWRKDNSQRLEVRKTLVLPYLLLDPD